MALSSEQIEILDKQIADKMPPNDSEDWEIAHEDADELLLEALKAAGFYRVVEAWNRVPKWYS